MRAVALYRASTKQQTEKDSNDIPAQRDIVRDFINNKQWNLVKEFVEGGISGFKVRTKDRDALSIIKAMAIDKEFDVLVVYMSDRIGRIADETPLVISFLNSYDVMVWSVSEGEIKTSTHTDKLITYIRYWQNEGESLKTAKRVTDYHKDMVKHGKFRGGNMIPFGYKLVDNGSKNFKGRNIFDFVIDEHESEIVKIIYSLSIDYNYGQHRTAKHLNSKGITNRDGKPWYASTIQNILSNQIYKGYFHMYSSLYQEEIISPVQENLIIISEEMWNKNQDMIQKRSYRTKKKNDFNIIDKRELVTKNTHGKMLLSGIIFCGHCGERLTTLTSYKRWTTKDGIEHREVYYRYRCGSFYKRDGIKCDGQSTYGTRKIEPGVEKRARDFMLKIQNEMLNENIMENFDNQIKKMQIAKEDVGKVFTQTNRELNVLKDEIAKSLLGESDYDSSMLKDLIHTKDEKLKSLTIQIKQIEDNIRIIKQEKENFLGLGDEFKNWDKKYDDADLENKKNMLTKIIESVKVSKDSVEINFRLPYLIYEEKSLCKIDRGVRTNSDILHGINSLNFTETIEFK